jgi:hypothetical protein
MKKPARRTLADGAFLNRVGIKPLLEVKFMTAGGAFVTIDGHRSISPSY